MAKIQTLRPFRLALAAAAGLLAGALSAQPVSLPGDPAGLPAWNRMENAGFDRPGCAVEWRMTGSDAQAACNSGPGVVRLAGGTGAAITQAVYGLYPGESYELTIEWSSGPITGSGACEPPRFLLIEIDGQVVAEPAQSLAAEWQRTVVPFIAEFRSADITLRAAPGPVSGDVFVNWVHLTAPVDRPVHLPARFRLEAPQDPATALAAVPAAGLSAEGAVLVPELRPDDSVLLRVEDGPYLTAGDGGVGFSGSADDAAAFLVRSPLDPADPSTFSFNLIGRPDAWLAREGGGLTLAPGSSGPVATWRAVGVGLPPRYYEITCAEAVQGVLAYDAAGSRNWNPDNVAWLCGASPGIQPAVCFEAVLNTGAISPGDLGAWNWQNATQLCAGTYDAEARIGCYVTSERVVGATQAVASCGPCELQGLSDAVQLNACATGRDVLTVRNPDPVPLAPSGIEVINVGTEPGAGGDIASIGPVEPGPAVPAEAITLPPEVMILAYSINDQVRTGPVATPEDYYVAVSDAGILIEQGAGSTFSVEYLDPQHVSFRLVGGPSAGGYLSGGSEVFTLGANASISTVFRVQPPLEPTAGNFASFEAVQFPGHYMRHQGFVLKLTPATPESDSLLRRDATFRIVPAPAAEQPAAPPPTAPAGGVDGPTDWLTDDNVVIGTAPTLTTSGPVTVGIRWTTPGCEGVDLDLYLRESADADWLYWNNVETTGGRYGDDLREGTGGLELAELYNVPDVRNMEILVNIYAGECPVGVNGIVRAIFDGQVREAPFSIASGVGNRGENHTQAATLPYWTVIDAGALLGVNGN